MHERQEHAADIQHISLALHITGKPPPKTKEKWAGTRHNLRKSGFALRQASLKDSQIASVFSKGSQMEKGSQMCPFHLVVKKSVHNCFSC